MRAQIQVIGIIGLKSAKATILEPKDELQNAANNNNRTLCALGGRCGDMEVCCFAEMPAGAMLIVHLLLNVRDAMGANTIDKITEHFAPMIDKLKVGKTQHSILSNLTIKRLVDATVTLNAEQFATDEFDGKEVIQGIVEALAFAEVDTIAKPSTTKALLMGSILL